MALPQPGPVSRREAWLGGGLLLLGAVFFVWAFSRLPLNETAQAFDWKAFWNGTHALRIDYGGIPPLYNPPWTLALLWALTVWPLATSWGLVSLATTAILAYSVPRHPQRAIWLTSLLALLLSYPALRHLVDGNIEALVIAGALLLALALREKSAAGLALAGLLLTAKVQASWLLLIILGLYIWRRWPRRDLLAAAGWAAAGSLPFVMWRGANWWAAVSDVSFTSTNISLLETLHTWQTPDWARLVLWCTVFFITLWVTWKQPELESRSALGALLAAGLLLSPYASTHGVLVPLAVGVVPVGQRRRGAGVLLSALCFIPYLTALNFDWRLQWENSYWTGVLLLSWLVLLWDWNREEGD